MKTVKRPLCVQLERIFISLGEAETYLDHEANVTEYMGHSVFNLLRESESMFILFMRKFLKLNTSSDSPEGETIKNLH